MRCAVCGADHATCGGPAVPFISSASVTIRDRGQTAMADLKRYVDPATGNIFSMTAKDAAERGYREYRPTAARAAEPAAGTAAAGKAVQAPPENKGR